MLLPHQPWTPHGEWMIRRRQAENWGRPLGGTDFLLVGGGILDRDYKNMTGGPLDRATVFLSPSRQYRVVTRQPWAVRLASYGQAQDIGNEASPSHEGTIFIFEKCAVIYMYVTAPGFMFVIERSGQTHRET